MASADGLYLNRAEVCMVLDWTVFYVNLLLILHASQTIAFLKGSVVEMTNAAD
jgi:hypothetical protein